MTLESSHRHPRSFEWARSRIGTGLFGGSHGARRNRRIAASVLASGGARGLQMLTTLMIIPFAYHYLGLERFGFWMALTSATSFLTFADLGIGNGLISAIAAADARNDREDARVEISTAFWMLSAVAIALSCAFIPLHRSLDWTDLFRLTIAPADREDVTWSVIAAFGCFAAKIPLDVA